MLQAIGATLYLSGRLLRQASLVSGHPLQFELLAQLDDAGVLQSYRQSFHLAERQRQRQQDIALFGQACSRFHPRGAMNPLMRDFIEPATDVHVGGRHAQRQARALERGRQWRDGTTFEVAIETLDFAFGLRAVGSSNARTKTVFVGLRQQPRMPAMLAGAIRITLKDDRAGVVEQRLLRHPTEIGESLAQTV